MSGYQDGERWIDPDGTSHVSMHLQVRGAP